MASLSDHESSEYIRVFRPAPSATLRLVCCPHAGASATALAGLARELPANIEALTVQYPDRRGESGFRTIEELADLVCAALAPWADQPLAVYGHSMGSAVAFEVTCRLEAAGVNVTRLFVSGRRSPSNGLGPGMPRNDAEIAEELATLGGVPPKLLAKPKFRESILSVIRHDYGVNSRYFADPGAMVRAPITFLLADSDVYIDAEGAQGWQQHTTGGFRVVRFSGGHFFFIEQLPQVVETITTDLRAAVTETPGVGLKQG